jgi:hypothetical protein
MDLVQEGAARTTISKWRYALISGSSWNFRAHTNSDAGSLSKAQVRLAAVNRRVSREPNRLVWLLRLFLVTRVEETAGSHILNAPIDVVPCKDRLAEMFKTFGRGNPRSHCHSSYGAWFGNVKG